MPCSTPTSAHSRAPRLPAHPTFTAGACGAQPARFALGCVPLPCTGAVAAPGWHGLPPAVAAGRTMREQSDATRAREERAIARALRALTARMCHEPPPRASSPDDAGRLATLLLGRCEREVFYVLFLDSRLRLIAGEPMFAGTLTETPIYVREVARRALVLNASAVIAAHNHPSGDTSASDHDRDLTRGLCCALDLVGVALIDHIIVGGGAYSSMRMGDDRHLFTPAQPAWKGGKA